MEAVFSRTKTDDINEAKALLQELFYQGNLTTRVRDAQLKLRRWTTNRVAELFYGKASRVDAFELETLRAMKRARQMSEARREYAAVNDDIARLEALLTEGDAPFHSETLTALGTIRRALDRPGTGRDK